MKKVILGLIIIGAAVFGFNKFQETSERNELARAMRDSSVRVSLLLTTLRSGSGATIGDILKMSSEHVTAISSTLFSVKSRIQPRRQDNQLHAVSYIEKCQIVARRTEQLTRKLIAFHLAKNAADDALTSLQKFVDNPSNDTARWSANAIDSPSISKQLGIAKQELDIATTELNLALLDLSEIRPPAGSGFRPDAYISKEDLTDIKISL